MAAIERLATLRKIGIERPVAVDGTFVASLEFWASSCHD
jgi:hypothetical protein